MTTTSFQDDFHREVERQSKEAEGIPQTAFNRPATKVYPNETKALIEACEGCDCPPCYQQTHAALEAILKAEREQTIRECAEIARTATMFTGCPLECMADEVRDAVLSLLQSNGEDK